MANIRPMKPSGVQLSRPIVPPGPADAHQLVRRGLVVRGEHDAHAGQDGVELVLRERQGLGVGLPPPQRRAAACRRVPSGVQQFRRQVARDHVGARERGGDGGVPGARRDVQHPLAGADPGGLDQNAAQVRDDLRGQLRIVPQRPHPPVRGLQRVPHDGSPRVVVSNARSPAGALLVQDLYRDLVVGSAAT
nr:hypothetical protein [Actinomadura madurae]